ncbi:unnamed protein product [Nezara viridula]|uniref:Neuropeptide n=1 Tax=Nezara viridula TaxID=85310 RepID=A0A9P0E6R4_NEZVI|nr:unnamed protein product [Nezara viridula]
MSSRRGSSTGAERFIEMLLVLCVCVEARPAINARTVEGALGSWPETPLHSVHSPPALLFVCPCLFLPWYPASESSSFAEVKKHTANDWFAWPLELRGIRCSKRGDNCRISSAVPTRFGGRIINSRSTVVFGASSFWSSGILKPTSPKRLLRRLSNCYVFFRRAALPVDCLAFLCLLFESNGQSILLTNVVKHRVVDVCIKELPFAPSCLFIAYPPAPLVVILNDQRKYNDDTYVPKSATTIAVPAYRDAQAKSKSLFDISFARSGSLFWILLWFQTRPRAVWLCGSGAGGERTGGGRRGSERTGGEAAHARAAPAPLLPSPLPLQLDIDISHLLLLLLILSTLIISALHVSPHYRWSFFPNFATSRLR